MIEEPHLRRPLVAKSCEGSDPPPRVMLARHLQDVYHAAVRLFEVSGHDQLGALGLCPRQCEARFRRCMVLAAALHDIGKANDHFQTMIYACRGGDIVRQGLRHEWVSILMLKDRVLRDWLLPAVAGDEVDFAIVAWAIAGHHPAANRESPPKDAPSGSPLDLTLLLGHRDFAAILEWLASTFELGTPPTLADWTVELVGGDSPFHVILRDVQASLRRWDSLTPADRRLVAALKAALVAADVAGSALPTALPDEADPWDWIRKSLTSKPAPDDLRGVAEHRLGDAQPRPFQLEVAASTASVTYVKAGCGTGKTVAAYLWAAENHPNRRLYFCYPTTGTATEGFRDYLFHPDGTLGDLGARLFHSRREVDLEMLEVGRDVNQADADTAARLQSLEAWSTPIVACTVDTVLGLMQNHRRGLYAWPALAQSAFVFDEIHAYDDQLFGTLLRFLRELPGLPVLLMTASLPKTREEALRNIVAAHRDMELCPIHGPAELEALPRYRKAPVGAVPMDLVSQTLKQGGKILWICNTVNRVMDAAAAAEAAGHQPLIYHSRFRYVDRAERHEAVIKAFGAPGAFAICSQVAEMSLDLSADLLVTDLAPVPSLIQRLGRLNRNARPTTPIPNKIRTKSFLIVEPDNPAPYDEADLEASRQWIHALPNDGISQRDLAEHWEQDADTLVSIADSRWLDGGPMTEVKELRELAPGITVIMKDDVSEIRTRKDLMEFVLPMPPHRRWSEWPRHKGFPVVDIEVIDYDAMRGGRWL